MSSDIATDALIDTEVADRIRSIVAEILRIDATDAQISEETNLYELGLESLNVVELLTQIEIAYDITIDVEDLSAELFNRFGTLVDFVQRKLDERG